MSDTNRKVFISYYEAFNRRDAGRMRELLAPGFLSHEMAAAGQPGGADDIVLWAEGLWTGLPDVHWHLEDVIAEDDKVVGRLRVTGTHDGVLFGMPPSGRSVDYEGVDIVRFSDGVAVEHWGVTDAARMMSQLGMAPAEGTVETVQAIYRAFAAQDIPAILDLIAEDVVWEEGLPDHGVPWLRPGTGRDAAGAFFQAVGERLDITGFNLRGLLGAGDHVAAVVDLTGTVRGSGADLSDPCEVHLWTIEDGRVTAFRHHVDTHRHVMAAG